MMKCNSQSFLSNNTGEMCVLTVVKKFGALATVTLTSFRKFFTIALSFILFPKPFVFGYLQGAVLLW